ncbi:MAG: M3 family metallopeptidase [Pseudomonadota bacterium]
MSELSINPLMQDEGLPCFDSILPAHVSPAVQSGLADYKITLETILSSNSEPTWANTAQLLLDCSERFSRRWGQVGHLNAVVNSPELREAYHANLPAITTFFAELGQNEALCRRYEALAKTAEPLSSIQKRHIELELRDFQLGGVALPPAEKERFKAIQEKLSELSAHFEEHLLDATNQYRFNARLEQLTGLPDDVIAQAQAEAQSQGETGYTLTLRAPCYWPVMQFVDDRSVREALYRAYVTRASEFGAKEQDNTPLVKEILELRHEAAQLLGFPHYAAYSLASKMADSADEVMEFLRDLAKRAKPAAERDLAELRVFAREHLALSTLEVWDIPYASEKLREMRYAFSEQELKQYFPEDQVLSGLFSLIGELYSVTIEQDTAPVWNPDVRFYSIKNQDKEIIGQFYLDLYARANKRGGAWMDDAQNRHRAASGSARMPVAHLIANLSAPAGDQPALFTHDEVITLFHECGHGLHHLLTEVEVFGLSGVQGVEWDAVELPSQFMENFCWEWSVLQNLTRHVETGESLPKALYDKIQAARHFQTGLQTVRQIELALYDLCLHTLPEAAQHPIQALERVREEVAVIIPPVWNRSLPHSFSHIFAGGYAAGYYSYKWAEVLSADAFECFEQDRQSWSQLGQRFRQAVLAKGGERPAMESFVAFRGRQPSIEPLLRQCGFLPGLSDLNHQVIS